MIGGEWRSRKISFSAIDSLRPTPDRVRETLFNWLRFDIEGAKCLDLFAGSGILGIEAASRGADHVVLVERDAEACRFIAKNLEGLGAQQIELRQQNVEAFLACGTPQTYDLIFLDPPFSQGLIPVCIEAIEQQRWATNGAKIYIEIEADAKLEIIPADWYLLKYKKAGAVGSYLYENKE